MENQIFVMWNKANALNWQLGVGSRRGYLCMIYTRQKHKNSCKQVEKTAECFLMFPAEKCYHDKKSFVLKNNIIFSKGFNNRGDR
jgi:hypothetical protein